MKERKDKMSKRKKALLTEGREPDCVTAVCRGGTVLVVKGYLKQGGTETAADKMEKALRAEMEMSQRSVLK